jgi:uncharacterized protein (DUF58 family)
MLVIDLRSGMFFGSRRCFKSVVAAHAAALLAWATLDAGDRIGAMLISDDGIIDIKPRRSRHTVLQLFRQLITIGKRQLMLNREASASPNPPSLQDAMQQLRAVTKPGSCTIIISDFQGWNEDCAKALYPVVRHSQCFAMQTSDILEQQLPVLGLVKMRSGARSASIDTQDSRMLARYQQERKKQHQQLFNNLRALKIPLLTLQTSEQIFPALRNFFSNGSSYGK